MRKSALVALVALLSLATAGAAAAKTKPKAEAFASKHHLKGSWTNKDADKDGLKNVQEFKLGTDPRKADTDGDGLKDGDELASGNNPLKADTDRDGVKDGKEHAGVVLAFDGETITLREFATGKKLTATLDTECTPALAEDEDPAADEDFDDGSYDDVDTGDGELFQDPADDEDLGADEDTCTDDDVLEKGVVLKSAELEDDYLISYEVA